MYLPPRVPQSLVRIGVAFGEKEDAPERRPRPRAAGHWPRVQAARRGLRAAAPPAASTGGPPLAACELPRLWCTARTSCQTPPP